MLKDTLRKSVEEVEKLNQRKHVKVAVHCRAKDLRRLVKAHIWLWQLDNEFGKN